MTADQFREALFYVAEAVAQREAELNALDSAIGDGDHGITMRNGFNAIRQRMEKLPAGTTIDMLLSEAAVAFMSSTGGAIGILMSRMLLAASQVMKGKRELDAERLQAMLAAMEDALAKYGKSQPGDKTILDAVHGARVALAQATPPPNDIAAALDRAAEGAEEGARRTTGMLCRMGRASRLGERVLGHADPGATSFALIQRALATWARAVGEKSSYPELAIKAR